MRYLESENPFVIARFTTGDTVKITIYDLSDNSKPVDDVSMIEIGVTGYFKYQFNPSPAALTEYLYITNNTIEEHAGKIILGGYPNSIKDETDKIQTVQTATDKMNFTGTDIKATLDNEEVTTDTASRTASKATGFAIENPPSQNLADYKADVSNLDVAVSTRNATTPPTTGEIKTELEAAGTKLTAVKDKTDNLKDSWNDPTPGEIDTELAGTHGAGSWEPSVGDIVDAVWDEKTAGHKVSGSTGAKLQAGGGMTTRVINRGLSGDQMEEIKKAIGEVEKVVERVEVSRSGIEEGANQLREEIRLSDESGKEGLEGIKEAVQSDKAMLIKLKHQLEGIESVIVKLIDSDDLEEIIEDVKGKVIE